MPIYTRKGDKGQTSLFDGTKVSKAHSRVDAYGTIDELNSLIGAAISHMKRGKSMVVRKELERIQHDLLDIGSALAVPSAMPVTGLAVRVKDFERHIDEMTDSLPELRNFILPGGSKAAGILHVSRTVARRAERRIVALMENERIDEGIVIYMNRLSDLLFTMARHVNFHENKKELVWVKK